MTTDSSLPFRCFLSVREQWKGIPYGGVDRGDGHANHGFMPRKGLPEPASSVPEAADDPALARAIDVLNEASTLFFTVGCEKSMNEQEGAFWKRGYLEFAFNDKELCSDSRNYFSLFQGFSMRLHTMPFKSAVLFEWELERARFLDVDVGGWTVAVWITTATVPTAEEAQRLWQEGLETLATAMKEESFPIRSPIYGSEG